MPHSSGGGSHGGGSHGGSHGGGFHSDDPYERRISRSYFPSAVRYRYYSGGRERFFYASRSYRPWSRNRLWLLLLYLPIMIVTLCAMMSTIRQSFHGNHETIYRIIDSAQVLEDTAHLEDALSTFNQKTGITSTIVTVEPMQWEFQADSLEDYAYERYLQEFSDEDSWLLVFSAGENWAFEGMQGDNTDSILTTDITSTFNRTLAAELEAGTDVSEAFADAFLHINDIVSKPSLLSQLFPYILSVLFLCFHAYFMLGLYELKYRKAERCPEEGGYNGIDNSFSNDAFSSGQYGYPQPYEQQPTQQPYPQPYEQQPTQQPYPQLYEQQPTQLPFPQPDHRRPFTESAKADEMPMLSADVSYSTCRYCKHEFNSQLTFCPYCGEDSRT